MKIETQGNAAVKSSNFKSQEFGIGDMSIVMNLLTNLYSRPIQTLTQEYICNARDANREVNSTRPIEIKCPTIFNPTMTIRDFGPGLSPDRIVNVFLKYGVSTKNTTNEFTGGFGIGGKSAWAYTDNFIIHSYHEGTHYTYAAIKTQNKPSLELLSKKNTKEPNGVSIEIKSKPDDISKFVDAIIRATYFWNETEKPVIKNLNEEINNSPLYVSKEVTLYENSGYYDNNMYNGTVAVIDGIPYDIDMGSFIHNIRGHVDGIKVLIFKTGELTIAPNREELIYDDKTNKALSNRLPTIYKQLRNNYETERKSCKSLSEYLKFYEKYKEVFNYKFEYKNLKKSRWNGFYSIDENVDGRVEDNFTKVFISSDNRIIKNKFKKLYPRNLENIYILDTNESGLVTNKRLRTIFKETNKTEILLLNNKKTIFHELGNFEKVSSFKPLETPKTPKTTKIKKDKTLINLTSKYKKTFTLEQIKELEETIVIAPYSKKHKLFKYLDYVSNFYFVSKVNEKLIKDLPNVVYLQEHLKTVKLTTQQKRYLVLKTFANDYNESYVFQRVLKIHTLLNKNLNTAKHMIKGAEYSKIIPELIAEYEKTNEFKQNVQFLIKTADKLFDRCPLLLKLDTYAILPNDKDIIEYINKNMTKGV